MLNNEWEPGISIVIPTLATGTTLSAALDSIAAQTVDVALVEVIVVVNGEHAEQFDCEQLQRDYATLSLRVFRSFAPGAGRARNLGIALARREFVTFVDDDDSLEPNFMRTALELASEDTCVLMPIVNIRGDKRDAANTLNVRITALKGSTVALREAPWAMGFNACKIIPTRIAQRYRYQESLRSGEDLVYFAHLLQESGLQLKVPANLDDCAYLRTLSDDSVSRQEESFDFNVDQRLQCIAALRRISVGDDNLAARQSIEKAQFGFVERYLTKHPDQTTEAIEAAVQRGVSGLNWGPLRRRRAKRLVFAYCFPPYADTSANVTAKVIRSRRELVDVYYANMSRVRGLDESTRLIVEPYLAHAEEIDLPPSFANWGLISDFGVRASSKAIARARRHGEYITMYSRALWSGSHVAAALYKKEFPKVFWEAEFSDPMRVGADGVPRAGELTAGKTTTAFRKMVASAGWGSIPVQTHFDLTELVTFIFADQLKFTNENQREIMLRGYPAELADLVRSKSVISPHEVPAKELYTLQESSYAVDRQRINIGYFGNFYENRGLGNVLQAIESLPPHLRERMLLHVFCGNPDKIREEIEGKEIRDYLRVNPYVPYLQFLNLATKFDVLVVCDTETQGSGFSMNPFLPSKYADYAGSGAAVWGIVSAGSPLSKQQLDYVSYLERSSSVQETLDTLLAEQWKEPEE